MKKHTVHKHPIFTSIVTGFGIIFLSISSSLTILAYNTPAVEIDNIHSLEEVLNKEKNILFFFLILISQMKMELLIMWPYQM